jgi:hypothetical protein
VRSFGRGCRAVTYQGYGIGVEGWVAIIRVVIDSVSQELSIGVRNKALRIEE